MSQLSHEEDLLDQALNNGEISTEEYNRELRDLHREYRDAAFEQAQEEFRDRVEEW